MGTSLAWVPETRPIPISIKPIPRYPCGFPNPCYALAISNLTTSSWALESIEIRSMSSIVPWLQDPFSHPLPREQESHWNCVLHLQLWYIGPTQIHMSLWLGGRCILSPDLFWLIHCAFRQNHSNGYTVFCPREYEVVQLRHRVFQLHCDSGVSASFRPTCFDWYTVYFGRTTQMDTLYYV